MNTDKHQERPAIATAPLTLVLVACNAGADIEAVVAAWVEQLQTRKQDWEIILVNDGSTDDTQIRADILTSRYERFRVIHLASRLGFGGAIRSGISAAKNPLLAYTTCDLQYQPGQLKLFLEQIDKVDLVTGYRLWQPVPPLVRWLGRCWRIGLRVLFGISLEPLPCWLGDNGQRKRWLARWVFGVRVRDVECAFRLARRSIFARLPIQSNGPFAQVEILAKANFLGCWMTEVPVAYLPPAGPPLCGSINPKESYLDEAYRLFSEASFGG